MSLRGRLYGARLSATASLEAHPRGAAAAPVRVPAHPDGEAAAGREAPSASPAGGTGGIGDTGGGSTALRPAHRFTARLPLEALLPGQRTWNLWLRPSAAEQPVRLARILDDVPDKKQIFTYPPQHMTAPDGSGCSARPYYTLDNDLSVRVSREEPV